MLNNMNVKQSPIIVYNVKQSQKKHCLKKKDQNTLNLIM